MNAKQKNNCACYTMSFEMQGCFGLLTDLLESVSYGEIVYWIYGFNN